MKRTSQLFTGLVFLVLSAQVPAVVLTVNGDGQLVSAWGVDVNGQLLDVEFRDGSCADLFSGCDASTDFFFQTVADAMGAAQALLDDVFQNGPQGNFGTEPELTSGCLPFSSERCSAWIPYALDLTETSPVFAKAASNRVGTDFLTDGQTTQTFDFGNSGIITWAIWSTTTVPSPPVHMLIAVPLLMVAVARSKIRRGVSA